MPFHYVLPEDPPTFPVFCKAVLHHWVVLMSGCGLIVLIGVIEKLSSINIPFFLYISVIVLILFIACFLAWVDVRKEMHRLSLEIQKKEQYLLDQEQDINEIKRELLSEKGKRIPQLTASIQEQSIAEIVHEGKVETAVTLKIVVGNIGTMPSAAINWVPYVFVANRNPRQCRLLHFTNELTLGYEGGVTDIIKSGDMIYEKTVSPIQPGAIVVGYLHFRTSTPRDEVIAPDSVIKVFFSDVKQKAYEINFEKNKSVEFSAPGYTPGVQTKRATFNEQEKSRYKRKKNRRKG